MQTLSLNDAWLELENGFVFKGKSFGFESPVSGEIVFNTGMVGYPQSLTDPSYKGQILCLTYPLQGNYGVPRIELDEFGLPLNFESSEVQVSGLVVQNYSFSYWHFEAFQSLRKWLVSNQVPALTGVDTRQITKILREKGSMLARIYFREDKKPVFFDPDKENLVKQVSCKSVEEFGKGRKTVALIDCGTKNNIIRNLVKRGLKVLRCPWDYPVTEKEKIDGLVVSNGPGNPVMVEKTIETIKTSIKQKIPLFGICLGNQLLAIAAGGSTFKLKYGHRSQNQPVQNTETKKCLITSQNHGFAVNTKTLSRQWKQLYYNLNDNTNEGIKHKKHKFFSVQFHPEAMPGPKDANFLFDVFARWLK